MENVEILQVNTQPSVKSISDLKKEIKDLKGQLLTLEQGTKEYNQVLTEVANKTHDLKEIQEQVARSSSDFGDQLRNVQGTVAGLSGAFQTVLGSLSLMGVEMGDDVKMLKMLQSAMAITQGVAAIDTGVKAFKALTISIKASTMAMSGLKKALITSGIGAAAIAVGVLVTKLSELKAEEEAAREATEKHNAKLKEQAELYKKIFSATQSEAEQKYYSAQFWRTYGMERVNAVKKGIDAQTAQKKAVEAYIAIMDGGFDKEKKFTAAGKAAWEEYFRWRVRSVPAADNELAATVMKEIDDYGKQMKEKAQKIAEDIPSVKATLQVQENVQVGNPQAETDAQTRELQALTEYYQRRAEIVISGETDAQDQLLQLDMDYRDKREELLRTRLENGLITEQEFNNELAKLEIEAVELQMEQEERLTEKKKEETEKRKAIEKSYLQSLKSVAGSISSILGSIGDNMVQGTQEWKNVKIAQATIDTISGGITAFMTTMQQIGGIPGIIAGAAAAAAVVATGIAEIAKIRNTKVSKGSAGGGNVSTPSAAAVSVNATQVTPTRQVQTEEDIANLPDTKVYVLEEDITNAQKKVQVTTENATY